MKKLNLKMFYMTIKKSLYLLSMVILGIISAIYVSYLFMLHILPKLPFEITIQNKFMQEVTGIIILGISYRDNEFIFLSSTILFLVAILLKKLKSRAKKRQV